MIRVLRLRQNTLLNNLINRRGRQAQPGIKTTLTLNKDKTFTLRSEYIDEKDGIFNDKGTYTLDGNILTAKQEGGDITYYKVEEGQLKMLDQQKQPVTGDLAKFYILKQTKKF